MRPSGISSSRPITQRRGFTLVEMLLVVAIIVLLVAMLLPVLGRARAEARRVVCGSNLGQIGKGMLDYHANEGALPASFTHQWSPQSLRGVKEPCAVWPAQVRKYAGGVNVFYCPEAPASAKWTPRYGGANPAMYGYEAGEYYVPGNPTGGVSYGHNNNGTRTHGQSETCRHGPGFLGMSDDPDPGGAHFYIARLQCVRQPDDFICFADSHLDGVWDAFVDYQVPGEDVSDRHYGLANMVFGDAHVEAVDPAEYEDNQVTMTLDPDKARRWNNDGVYP